MPCVYILRSRKTNRYYVGCTENLADRIHRHNAGYVRSTKAYRPWELMYQERYSSLKAARRREKQIKAWKSRKRIEALAPSSSG